MPLSKGLASRIAVRKFCARLNSIVLCLLLGFSPGTGLSPLEGASRKGDKFVKDAQLAEAKGDYDKALELFEQALALDPREPAYRLGVNRLRFQAAQKLVDRGEKLRAQGKLEEALQIFQKAFALDPASTIAEQRMRQTYEQIKKEQDREKSGQPKEDESLRGQTPADRVRIEAEKKINSLMDAPVLKPLQREIVNLKMNNQPARVLFETLAKMAGINVMFDPDFISQNSGKNFPVDFQNTTLEEALDYLGILTKAYWKPISANAIYITLDNPQKRRDYEDYILKVFYLQHALEPQELNEIANAVRVVGECRKVVPYPAQMALMVRCTADQVALVGKIINDMDKPRSEVVLDVFVLEANRTRTRSLAAAIANAGRAGINQTISFTPRNPTLTGGSNSDDDTSTSTNSGLVALSQIGKISTNDFSINLPGGFLQALLEDRQTRVLQNPQVRTVDNKKASLRIGDRYPYATGSLNTGGIGGGVGGISPVVQTQFQFAEVGVNVDITPKIHGNEEISLRVEVEVSNIRDQVDIGGLRQPVIGQRKIGEDIRIKEGEINVMGGLSSTNSTRTKSGLPGLLDVPGLGWLFGSDGSDKSESELLIILVPHLVRAPEVTDLNLRGVNTGTDATVKLSYQMREAPPAAPRPGSSMPASPAPATTPSPASANPASANPSSAPPSSAPPLVIIPRATSPQPSSPASPPISGNAPASRNLPVLGNVPVLGGVPVASMAQQASISAIPTAPSPNALTPNTPAGATPAVKPSAPAPANAPRRGEDLSAATLPLSAAMMNATARVGRPPERRNKLILNAQNSEVFLSAPITVNVDVEYGEDLADAPLVLDYDRQVLKLIGAASGGFLSADGQKEEFNADLAKGELKIKRLVGSGGVSGNGTLLKLTFATLAKGEAFIRVASAELVNGRKEPLPGAPLPEILVKVQ